ncbi:RHS repeat-associated core domain-containing protein [Pseudomonas sp. Sample_10]|uniref:RHS repeat-associated core domain-containing protein n=1 Tax=Pseudomonas sp. Sample_10 TaxID=2448269 RepID=UPI001036830A|nr:RHS repeat-associated core domain-containing protein [Pseudomonas sp. Sample_10]
MSQPGDQDDRSRSRTVLLATDSSQSVIGEIVDGRTQTIAYSAYGEQSAQQKVETRLGFNGQLREANIGWYLLGNGYRAYNPRLMRFHSPDSWSPFGGGGLNAYMYCVGDPVNSSDPTGHFKTGDSKLKGIRKLDAFLFGGSTVTGAYGNAPSIGGGPSLATSVKAPVKAPGNRSFINSLISDVAVMAGYGASRRAPGKIASPSSGKNGADGVTIGGEGNPGIDMLNFAKQNSNKMDILSSRPPSFDIPAQKKNVSPPTSARATASTVTPSYPDFKWSNNGLGLKGGREPVRQHYDFGANAPHQAPAGTPAPAPHVAELNHLLNGLEQLNDMHRGVIRHRLAAAVQLCRIL